MNLGHILTRGWPGSRRRIPPPDTPSDQTLPWSNWQTIQGQVFLFGIEWEISPLSGSKNQELQSQRKLGNKYYAISQLADVIGYVRELPLAKGKKYAAALHLSDRLSQGGIEIFSFHLKDDLYAFIALNESKPVPGHDYVGPKENVWQLGQDFANLQEQQAIRYVGNSGIFVMEETLTLDKAFADAPASAQIKTILNQPLIAKVLASALTVCGLLYGVDAYLTHVQQQEQLRQQALLNDPNLIYEKNIEPALRQVTAGGRSQIDLWMKTIGQLPLRTAGWRLDSVKCNLQDCTALWHREYGNFAELFQNLSVPFTSRSENMDVAKPAQSTATTTHPLPHPPQTNTLTRKELPLSKDVLSQFSSQLQDLSLLDNAVIALDKPSLFPNTGQGSVDALQRPVVKGTWGLQLSLWSITSLQLFPFVVPETLEIQFPDGRQDEAAYALKGSFYALYK